MLGDARERTFMRRAMLLARRGWGHTAPNPLVGCVIVRDGAVVAEGFHARFGWPHAEVAALTAAGPLAAGADVFVTLEPCNHHGKTPPCVDALLRAGVRRVVAAVRDPGTDSGSGAERLRAGGVEVEVGLEQSAAEELNAPFLFASSGSGRPWITLKLALSADGAIADASRTPRWLTGEPARRYVHRLRAQSDAIAVGAGTAVADDPDLTVRYGRRPRVAPMRVVFDRDVRLPIGHRLVMTARKTPTILFSRSDLPDHAAPLISAGVDVVPVSGLAEALGTLRSRGVRSLMVEGGAGLARELLAAGVVDRLIIFQAPVLLGAGALPAFGRAPPVERMRVIERREFGDDLMTTYAVNELPVRP